MTESRMIYMRMPNTLLICFKIDNLWAVCAVYNFLNSDFFPLYLYDFNNYMSDNLGYTSIFKTREMAFLANLTLKIVKNRQRWTLGIFHKF